MSNRPKKHRSCPIDHTPLTKVEGRIHTWECSKCGLRIYPNLLFGKRQLKTAAAWWAEAERSFKQK